MFTSILATIAELLGLAGLAARMRERADAEKTGAIKQREADARAEAEKTREQLDEAVNRKPGDGRRALDRGDY